MLAALTFAPNRTSAAIIEILPRKNLFIRKTLALVCVAHLASGLLFASPMPIIKISASNARLFLTLFRLTFANQRHNLSGKPGFGRKCHKLQAKRSGSGGCRLSFSDRFA